MADIGVFCSSGTVFPMIPCCPYCGHLRKSLILSHSPCAWIREVPRCREIVCPYTRKSADCGYRDTESCPCSRFGVILVFRDSCVGRLRRRCSMIIPESSDSIAVIMTHRECRIMQPSRAVAACNHRMQPSHAAPRAAVPCNHPSSRLMQSPEQPPIRHPEPPPQATTITAVASSSQSAQPAR